MRPMHFGAIIAGKVTGKNPDLYGCKGCFCPINRAKNILLVLEMESTPSPSPTIP